MWVKFDIEGLKFELKVENYISNQTIDEAWANVSFNFEFQNIIKYSKDSSENLLCREIDDLMLVLEDLLDNKLNEREEFGCIEPDFTFVFNPKGVNGSIDITMELQVNLWYGGLTCNYFSTTFCREEIEQLYLYLSLITNKIEKDDYRIISLIEKGILYGDL